MSHDTECNIYETQARQVSTYDTCQPPEPCSWILLEGDPWIELRIDITVPSVDWAPLEC